MGQNQTKYHNIQEPPFEVSTNNEKELYKLQKMFRVKGKAVFSKIYFKNEDVGALAHVLFKFKPFKKEYNKIRRGEKK